MTRYEFYLQQADLLIQKARDSNNILAKVQEDVARSLYNFADWLTLEEAEKESNYRGENGKEKEESRRS